MSEDPTSYKVSRRAPSNSIKIRINNIEFHSSSLDRSSGEFVKYYKNERYGKIEKYLEDGYVYSSCKNFLVKGLCNIDVSLFKKEETCFVISFLKYVENEDCCTLTSVGSRILNLSPEDREDFFSVYSFAEARMITNNTYDTNNN